MESSLVPIIENVYSITCIASWYSKLFLGTEANGVYVYDVMAFQGQREAFPNSSHQYLSPNTPVQQLSVLRSQNLLLLFSQGKLWIYEIWTKTQARVSFEWSQTIEKGTFKKFSVRPTLDPAICIANDECIRIYQYAQGRFHITKKLNYVGDSISFALTNMDLYVVSQHDQKHYLSIWSEVPENNVEQEVPGQGPAFVQYIDPDSVFLHQFHTSIIYKNRFKERSFQWSIPPTSLVLLEKYCIGLSEITIEILDLAGKSRCINLPPKEQQRYIMDEHGDYVANKNSVWCLLHDAAPNSTTSSPQTPLNLKLRHEEIHDNRERDSQESLEPVVSEAVPNFPDGWEMEYVDNDSVPLEMPWNFSPNCGLHVLGMQNRDLQYCEAMGVKTVRDFAQIPRDLMELRHPMSCKRAHNIALSYTEQYNSIVHHKSLERPALEINPDDLVEVLHLTKTQIEFLASIMVFTVRHFAHMSPAEVYMFGEEMVTKHIVAVRASSFSNKNNTSSAPSKYGYLALNAREFAQVIESRSIKSPYVLFQEYLEREPLARDSHPWKDAWRMSAFRLQLEERRRDIKNSDMTDLDLFSYLCWCGTIAFGKTDSTASARAIFFYWDSLTGSNAKDNNVIRIDLTALCKSHGGKLYTECEGGYIPTDLTSLETGKNHGCIVLPSGEVSWDCMLHILLE